jgi:hypothetical protein
MTCTFKDDYTTLSCGTRIYLITVATKTHPMLELLQQTCDSYHVPLNIFAMNDPRFQTWGQNFGVKIECLQQFCDRIMAQENGDKNSYFIFIDAFDVMMIRDLETFFNIYKTFQSDIVYSGEVFCHPDTERAQEYPAAASVGTYRFLNSGTFCGRVQTMHQMMKQHCFDISDDDQRYHTDLYLQHYNESTQYNQYKCVIDTEAKLFMCLSGSSYADLGVEINHFINRRTDTKPCILHFNTCAHLLPRTFLIWKDMPAYIKEQSRWTTMLRSRKRKGFPSVNVNIQDTIQ